MKTGEKHEEKQAVVGETREPDKGVNRNPDVAKSSKVKITFRENRRYELHLGRRIFLFLGRETKKIEKDLLYGEDWNQAKNLFVVKE